MFHRGSSRGAAKDWLARRPTRFRAGLYDNILSGEESKANAGSWPCSQPQPKTCEMSGLVPGQPVSIADAGIRTEPPNWPMSSK